MNRDLYYRNHIDGSLNDESVIELAVLVDVYCVSLSNQLSTSRRGHCTQSMNHTSTALPSRNERCIYLNDALQLLFDLTLHLFN